MEIRLSMIQESLYQINKGGNQVIKGAEIDFVVKNSVKLWNCIM